MNNIKNKALLLLIAVCAMYTSQAQSFEGTAPVIVCNASVSASVNNITCNNANDGSISMIMSNGTAPYCFTWNDCSNCSEGTRTGLAAGTYTVTGTDANGCTATGTYTITNPSAINLKATVSNISSKNTNSGSISLAVTGGVSPYTYSWPGQANGTESSITDLPGGSYSVIVTDEHGCSASGSYAIIDPSLAMQ